MRAVGDLIDEIVKIARDNLEMLENPNLMCATKMSNPLFVAQTVQAMIT
jgi:hypothetical protein